MHIYNYVCVYYESSYIHCLCLYVHVHIFNAGNTSCDGCFSTNICEATTGNYSFNVTLLFDRSPMDSPCGLHILNDRNSFISEITEGMCMDLSPHNYSIQCPIICTSKDHIEVHYKFPTSNVESCTNPGTYVYIAVK